MDTIKKAYDDGLIFSGAIGYGEFEEMLEAGEEKCLERLKNNYKRQSLDDIHDSMSEWACFNQAKKDPVHIEGPLPSKVPALKGKTKKIGRYVHRVHVGAGRNLKMAKSNFLIAAFLFWFLFRIHGSRKIYCENHKDCIDSQAYYGKHATI